MLGAAAAWLAQQRQAGGGDGGAASAVAACVQPAVEQAVATLAQQRQAAAEGLNSPSTAMLVVLIQDAPDARSTGAQSACLPALMQSRPAAASSPHTRSAPPPQILAPSLPPRASASGVAPLSVSVLCRPAAVPAPDLPVKVGATCRAAKCGQGAGGRGGGHRLAGLRGSLLLAALCTSYAHLPCSLCTISAGARGGRAPPLRARQALPVGGRPPAAGGPEGAWDQRGPADWA